MSDQIACEAQSVINTDDPEKYLHRMGRHFAHKLNVQISATTAVIEFSIGRCNLKARPGSLYVRCESSSAAELTELKAVVKDHFDRFALREGLSLRWAPATAADAAVGH